MERYLIHSAKGSTWSKKDHKYISRKKVNGRWVYTYNNPESRNYRQDQIMDLSTREMYTKSKSPQYKDELGMYDNIDDLITALKTKRRNNAELVSKASGITSKHTYSDNVKKYDQAIKEANDIKKEEEDLAKNPTILKKLKHIRHSDNTVYLVHHGILGQKWGIRRKIMYTENEYYGNMPKSNIVSHSAKGSTWSKSGAKYMRRYWKNGKWYYEYADRMKKAANKDVALREQRKNWKENEKIAKNRERQAKILKGKTGGVVNSDAKKDEYDSIRKLREEAARVYHLKHKPVSEKELAKNRKYKSKMSSREEDARVNRKAVNYKVRTRKDREQEHQKYMDDTHASRYTEYQARRKYVPVKDENGGRTSKKEFNIPRNTTYADDAQVLVTNNRGEIVSNMEYNTENDWAKEAKKKKYGVVGSKIVSQKRY